MSDVSLTQISNNTIESFKYAIDKSLEELQYNFPKNIENIVIKPNMCYYWDYTTGQTTDPRFVLAIIQLLHERYSSDINISVVESDASAMKCKYAFKMLGYEKLFKGTDVKLINLSNEDSEEMTVKVNNNNYDLLISRTMKEADLKINVPKIKYMSDPVKLTCALKNIYGCNPSPNKHVYHKHINEVIVAINKIMKFELCIVDGNYVSGMRPSIIGLIMSSIDPVAIDAVASKIVGINPKSIQYLQLAKKEGIGSTSYKLIGESINYYKKLYPNKTIKNKIVENIYHMLLKSPLGKRIKSS